MIRVEQVLTGVQDSADPTLFATEVRNCAGSTISLGVFSAKVWNILLLKYTQTTHRNTSFLLPVTWVGFIQHASSQSNHVYTSPLRERRNIIKDLAGFLHRN